MLLVSLASDFLVSIENHNSEGKERKINKGRRRTEKAIGHFLKNSRRGGGQSVFYGEAPPRGPAPYPLYIIFDRKGAPFVFRWLTNDTPFTYLVFLSVSHTYKFAVFKMWINHKTRKFSRLFHSHKIHLLILLSIFTDRFDRFPFPFIYSRTCEIPHPLIPEAWKRYRVLLR